MVECRRLVLTERIDVDRPFLRGFPILHCLPIILKLLLDELLHEHTRMMQCSGPIFLSFLKDGVLLLRHVIRHQLVVLRVILHVEVVLAVARVVREDGLRLRREILGLLFCWPGVLLLFQSHHFLDHCEVRNGRLVTFCLGLIVSIPSVAVVVLSHGIRADKILPESRIVQFAN